MWRTTNGELPQSYLESFGGLPENLLSSPSLKKELNVYNETNECSNKQSFNKNKNKKRGIFDSLRNGQPFLMKTHGKSNSQTELLNCENEGENTLFQIESIGKDLETTKNVNEEVTLIKDKSASNSFIVVHFNRTMNNNEGNLIGTFQ